MDARWLGLVSVVSMTVGATVSCSSADEATRRDSAAEAVGSAGLALTPVAGVTINSFSYVVTGPGGFSRTGTVDVSHSATLSTLLSGLPVGTGVLKSVVPRKQRMCT